MYRWRKLTGEDRRKVLEHRMQRGQPVHSPQHFDSGDRFYHITAACFEHATHIGHTSNRMSEFAAEWLLVLQSYSQAVNAWAVLPNHYHALVRSGQVLNLLAGLGKLHGRTSHAWNGEDAMRGRQVWCKATETMIKSDGHYHATVNYIHHNPVKHRYVEKWTDWPWSSATEWLKHTGRDAAEAQWRRYPIKEFGSGWDDPEM